MNSMFTSALLTVSPLIFGFASGLNSRKEIDTWYNTLNQPSIKPPNWVFGPVWSTLYLAMGYASKLVYESNSPLKNYALSVYGIQLLLNLAWTPLFFTHHKIGAGLVNILALDAAVVYTIKLFMEIDETSGYLLLPYLAWISFASLLNFEFWRLNKTNKKD